MPCGHQPKREMVGADLGATDMWKVIPAHEEDPSSSSPELDGSIRAYRLTRGSLKNVVHGYLRVCYPVMRSNYGRLLLGAICSGSATGCRQCGWDHAATGVPGERLSCALNRIRRELSPQLGVVRQAREFRCHRGGIPCWHEQRVESVANLPGQVTDFGSHDRQATRQVLVQLERRVVERSIALGRHDTDMEGPKPSRDVPMFHRSDQVDPWPRLNCLLDRRPEWTRADQDEDRIGNLLMELIRCLEEGL
jgi:hypothetical protein